LLEPSVILFHSKFAADNLKRIYVMVLSRTSAATECRQKRRGSRFGRFRHDQMAPSIVLSRRR
jgi:hypothetical protein